MIAAVTDSGLAPGKWTKCLLDLFDARRPQSNWVFQHPDGTKMKMADFNDQFYDAMSEIQARRPDLITPDEVIADRYFLARSFRRGATTRAQLARVDDSIINWVNRWGTGQEILVKGPMRIIYSERKLMLNHFLKFSRAL
jgi:hypothetical protein